MTSLFARREKQGVWLSACFQQRLGGLLSQQQLIDSAPAESLLDTSREPRPACAATTTTASPSRSSLSLTCTHADELYQLPKGELAFILVNFR